MNHSPEIISVLKKLRLSGVLQTIDLRNRQATEDSLSCGEFLFRLLQDEVERREAKQLEQRLRRASFEHNKTIESFDFTFNPRVPKAKIIDLGTCAFIAGHENVCLMGPTGTGKSHIAQAIGHRACRAGYSVLNVSAHHLLKELRAARADGSYDRRLLRFTSPDLLIIDDLGLRPLQHEEPMDLYEIIRQRYERGSLIVTSNRAIDEWPPLFGDALLASAAMDRLLHHAHLVTLDGYSYRNPPGGAAAGGPRSEKRAAA